MAWDSLLGVFCNLGEYVILGEVTAVNEFG